jgi:hypothetical protein
MKLRQHAQQFARVCWQIVMATGHRQSRCATIQSFAPRKFFAEPNMFNSERRAHCIRSMRYAQMFNFERLRCHKGSGQAALSRQLAGYGRRPGRASGSFGLIAYSSIGENHRVPGKRPDVTLTPSASGEAPDRSSDDRRYRFQRNMDAAASALQAAGLAVSAAHSDLQCGSSSF